jgi:hypothetical protein
MEQKLISSTPHVWKYSCLATFVHRSQHHLLRPGAPEASDRATPATVCPALLGLLDSRLQAGALAQAPELVQQQPYSL